MSNDKTMDRRLAEQKRRFDNLDYNNQRNLLWRVVDIARGTYKMNMFPYKECKFLLKYMLFCLGEKRVAAMATRLTENYGKMNLTELLGATR